MFKGIRRISFAAGMLIAGSSAIAPMAHADGLSLLNFQAGGIGIFSGGGNTFSGQISYAPAYHFMERYWGRLDLAATSLKGTLDNHFLALSYEALGGAKVWSNLGVEAGVGAESWLSNGGTYFVVGGNAVWLLENKLFGVIDRVYAGYQHGFISAGSNEIKAGIGLSF